MKVFSILFIFCWCVNIYGQESITDSTYFDLTDITYTTSIPYVDSASVELGDEWMYLMYFNPNLVEFLELFEEYETQCFNDSTKQCFNYYQTTYYLPGSALYSLGVGEDYKVPCSKHDYDLGIDMNYKGTHKEWVHVQPSFIGFIKFLKERMRKP